MTLAYLFILGPVGDPLVALLIGALLAFVVVRRRKVIEAPLETRIAELTDKVRHPIRYRLSAPVRWFR